MDPRHWPLIGRSEEYAAIEEALAPETGHSLVIAGPAGVGRSRLAREALRVAETEHRPTRWVVATAAAAQVPLAALAHLLPAVEGTSDPFTRLQHAALALAGEGPVPVLGVDDVHLLDPLSLTLLHQLAVTGSVTLVLTVRTNRAAPDPATLFWKDGLAARLELDPLSRPDTDQLVGTVLDADVDTRTCERLWQLSQGYPLYLRELVDDGRRTGRLHAARGLWRWEGPMDPSERLSEIVLAQLGDLDAAEWRALELLATAEPLAVQELVDLSGPDAVSSLERRGLVTVDSDGRVRTAHPLYTGVVRGRVPEAALTLIRGRLAEGIDTRSPAEVLRRCALLVGGSGRVPDALLLVQAARQAVAASDHPLAERLAGAGLRAGAGAEAHVVLAEALYWQGRPAVSAHLATEAAHTAVTDRERARLAAIRALALFCGLGQPSEAETVLERAEQDVRAEDAHALLVATQAVLRFLAGDPREAVRRGSTVLQPSVGSGMARPLAAAAVAAGLAVTGETGRALVTVHAGWATLEAEPGATESAFVRIALAQAELMALELSGQLAEMDRRAAELHRRNLTAPEWAGDAVASLHRGWSALAGGRPLSAIRWLTEALAGLEMRDPAGMLPGCVAAMGVARALAGDAAGVREVLADTDRARHRAVRVFDPQTGLAFAWLAAAEGRMADAGRAALDAAALAAQQGQWAVEATMLHSALRFGRAGEVVDRLEELAGRLDSPTVVRFALHAQAVTASSAERLEVVSLAFEEAGALLPAADAAARAAAVYERGGDRRAAASATARAVALTRDSGLAGTPALQDLSRPVLTPREAQVAQLAGRGLSNQAIAGRLVLSVRTVEAHLAHAYMKLGISGRLDLTPALRYISPS
jgi:DNA-binding NarL/FixJ family response regulator